MKRYLSPVDFIVLCIILVFGITMERSINAQDLKNNGSLYQANLKSITGKPVDMSEFKGKVALVVNTASKCGFTSQYQSLEDLYQKYKDKGFVVLGFPSNDFAKQEPGSNEEIASFCKVNYGVSFPLFEKGPVTGDNKQEAYKILTEQSAKDFNGDPGWNFVKFLLDKNGIVRARYASITSPTSKSVTNQIESLLQE